MTRRALSEEAPDSTVPVGSTIDELERRLAAVEARLTIDAGDRSLCDLSRSGMPPGIKELEGRMSALLEARRLVRRSGESAIAAVRSVLDEWSAEAVADSTRGPVWQAYRTGGIDELKAVLQAIAR